MAVFNLSNAAGRGFNMSSTNSDGWALVGSDPNITTQLLADDGKFALYKVYGSSFINSFVVDYTWLGGSPVTINGVAYGKDGVTYLTVTEMNLHTTLADLQAGIAFIRLNAENDVFYGNDYDDVIRAGYGNDIVFGYAGNNALFGDQGNDELWGGLGSDWLDGGVGADSMSGGPSNDFYVVDNAYDVVDESRAGSSGVDTVQSFINFSLANTARVFGAVENLTLLGSGNLSGTGNALNNVITGNAGANVLNGSLGADIMRGRAGNDVYFVDNSGDIVDEGIAGSGGIDSVQASISYSLANTARVLGAVENLILTGSGNISGTGNALHNAITGNAGANLLSGGAGNDTLNGAGGNDVLYGGAGNDVLTGGAGYDFFVLDTAISASNNVDRIVDFNVTQDTIRLDNAVMPALGSRLGTLSAASFWKSSTGLAHDSSDRIIYETDTGWLNYDSNGSAAGGLVHIAKLAPNLALTHADFQII